MDGRGDWGLDDSAVTCRGCTIDTSTHSTHSSDISTSSNDQTSTADYHVRGLIGRGKNSQVYSAVHLPSGMTVALKKVAIFEMMRPQARAEVLTEVKLLQNLDHPHIIKCFDSFIQDSELIIVLEWAESGDLGQLLRTRASAGQPFTWPTVWTMFSQICGALCHMHTRRMMHRDLKPCNILVTQQGVLKLGDLGLSRYFSSRTVQVMTTVGTPYYMSPECIKEQPYEFSSDIWSLGCLLYEIITLRNPFAGNHSMWQLGRSISSCTYEPLQDCVPAELRRLVTWMLQPTPAQRPTMHALCTVCEQQLQSQCL